MTKISVDYLLRRATSSVEIRVTERGGLLRVDTYEILEVLGNSGILEDSLHGTLSLTCTAVDALVWVDHEHADIVALGFLSEAVVIFLLLDVVETINWAHLYTRAIFGTQAIYSNDVSHDY